MALRKPSVDIATTTVVDAAADVVDQTVIEKDNGPSAEAQEAAKLKAAEQEAAKAKKAQEQEEAKAKEINEEVEDRSAADTANAVKVDAVVGKDSVEPEARAVAVQSTATQAVTVSEQRGGMFKQFKEELAAEGFEDMEVTGMSFERVRLHEGTFKIGGDDAELGKEFKCIILSSRAIYVVRQSAAQDAEMFYSYDPAGQFKTDGTSAEETLTEWRVDGYGVEGSPLEIKPYREVMATLKGRDDEYDEMVVSLSIPPASVDRIAGVAFTAKQKFKALPSGVITECKVGKLVGEGTKAFRPWIFKVTQTVEQFEAAQSAE